MVVACLIAGGVGARLGADRPKQFIEVQGKPVIVYTMQRLEESPDIDHIVVACLDGYADQVREWARQYHIHKLHSVVPGGASFGESVRNGVYSLEGFCREDDIFILHMSIAPLVPDDVIEDLVRVCRENGNAFTAVPSYLCMCEQTGEGYSDKYLDREVVYGLNTPQAVRYGRLLALYRRAEREGYDIHERTHVSTLLFDMGDRVYFSKSSSINIKITTRDDLELFEAVLLLRENKEDRKIAE